MAKLNAVQVACINQAIANAKAVKSREAIHAAVICLAKNASISYGAAAKLLRVKSGLDTPDADEARALTERRLYLGSYVTPAKDHNPVTVNVNEQPVKGKQVKPVVVKSIMVIPSDPNFFA